MQRAHKCGQSSRIFLTGNHGGCVMAVWVALCSVMALALSAFPVAAQHYGRSAPSISAPSIAAPPSVAAPSVSIPSAVPSLPSAPSIAPPAAATAPSPVPYQQVPTCRRPEDCPEDFNEKARRRFAECIEKSRTGPESLDRPTLEECALGVLSPNRFTNFRQCLSASGTAWDCYRQAYR
jgi:hypothetical protein